LPGYFVRKDKTPELQQFIALNDFYLPAAQPSPLRIRERIKPMKYIIADKLNFLMKVTGTKNNMLGRALSFDASHISRIRSGDRGLPSRREFIVPAAGYFARAVKTATQRNALARRICPNSKWPESLEEATLLIAQWLSEDVKKLDYESLNRYFSENEAAPAPPETGSSASGDTTQFYLGNEGKRQCVIRFLTGLAAKNEPVTLLLHSEESMEWIYEKPEFAKQWGQLLITLLQQGGHILIIHTLTRSFEEMLEAVTKWAPLYATGSIESFYYPKLRDNVFRRTLFIARGNAAIVACTTGESSANRLNMLIYDPAAVKALEQEYYDFLYMCRPLMQIFTPENFLKIIPVLGTFRKADSVLIQFHVTPSLAVLPDEVAEGFSRRPGFENFADFLADHHRWLFRQGKAPAHDQTDIVYLPDISTVIEGKIQVPLTHLSNFPCLFYTPEEYSLHLKNALHRMESTQTYRMVLLGPDTVHPVTGRPVVPSFSIVASQQAGVLLFSTKSPQALFYTKEPTITSAFCEYLEGFIKNAASREETLQRLRQYIIKLDEAIEKV